MYEDDQSNNDASGLMIWAIFVIWFTWFKVLGVFWWSVLAALFTCIIGGILILLFNKDDWNNFCYP